MRQALLESPLQMQKLGEGRFKSLAPDCIAVNDRVQIGVWAVGLLSLCASPRPYAFSQLQTSQGLVLLHSPPALAHPCLSTPGILCRLILAPILLMAMPGDFDLGPKGKGREGSL